MTDEELIAELKTIANYGSPHARILRLAAERLEALLDGEVPVPKGMQLWTAISHWGHRHEVTLMKGNYVCSETAPTRRAAVTNAAALIGRLKRAGHPRGDYRPRAWHAPVPRRSRQR